MARYIAKIKDNFLKIKVKLSWGEELDEYQLKKMTDKKLHGFLKPEQIRRGVIEYSGPVAVSLSEWMSRPVDRFGFYFMMAQVVNAVVKIQANELLLNKLVLDPRYVYINETTREVQFIYLPLKDDKARTDAMQFMSGLCDSVRLLDSNDLDCVSDFYFFLQALGRFDPMKIWHTILRTEPKAIARLRRRNFGQSGAMSERLDMIGALRGRDLNDGDDPTGLMEELEDELTGLMNGEDDEDDLPTGILGGTDDSDDDFPTDILGGAGDSDDDFPTDILGGAGDSDDDFPTGLLGGAGDSDDDFPTGLLGGAGDSDDDFPTGLLGGAGESDDDFPTGLLGGAGDSDDDFPTGLLGGAGDSDDDFPTGLLGGAGDSDDDLPTGLLGGDEPPVSQPAGRLSHVSLRRVKTNEEIEIRRTMFRVGRSRDMDYAIRDNGKVSRNHLEIVTRGRRIFAVDLDSTCGTYINGRRLTSNVEEELHDGDRLQLANEEFIFTAY